MKKESTLMVILLFLSVTIISISQPLNAETKTITVPDDYSTIKDAISNANDGDTIFIREGTYQENNTVISKALKIIGEDKETTIIRGQSSSFILKVNHNQVTISGLTLIAGNTPKPIVEAHQYDKEIVGIQIERVLDCNITGNKIINSGTAIWVDYSNNTNIQDNSIWDNYYGIDIVGGSFGATIKQNDISSSEVGIRFSGRMVNTIVSANNITSATLGFFYYFTSNNFVVGNYIAYNLEATYFISSYANVLHHNNFVHNSKETSEGSAHYDYIMIRQSINFWDDKKEGNYWTNYTGTGSEPYIINVFNKDNYPLPNPVNIEEYLSYSSTELPYPAPTTPALTNTPTATNYPSPTVPELSFIIIPIFLAVTLCLVVMVKNNKRLTSKQSFPLKFLAS
jgi:parallel beta-helix repeat protein